MSIRRRSRAKQWRPLAIALLRTLPAHDVLMAASPATETPHQRTVTTASRPSRWRPATAPGRRVASAIRRRLRSGERATAGTRPLLIDAQQQMTIAASEATMATATKPEIRDFARRVIDAQQSEIETLTAIRAELTGDAAPSA